MRSDQNRSILDFVESIDMSLGTFPSLEVYFVLGCGWSRPFAAVRRNNHRRGEASSVQSFMPCAASQRLRRSGLRTLRTCSLAANARAESPNRSSHLQHREFGSIADFPIPVIQEQCETSATSAIAARAASSLSLIRSLIKARECCAERGGRSEI